MQHNEPSLTSIRSDLERTEKRQETYKSMEGKAGEG
jgi:hypothetical protein